MRSGLILFALVTACLLTAVGPAAQKNIFQKISPPLDSRLRALQNSNFNVILILNDQANIEAASTLNSKAAKGQFVAQTLKQKALSTQGPLILWLENNKVSYSRFYIVNMVQAENVSGDQVRELAKRGDVKLIVENSTIRVDFSPVKSQAGKHFSTTGGVEPNIASTGAPRIWEEFGKRGEGMTVASEDTGVQWDHPALKTHYAGYSPDQVSHDYSWHDSTKFSAGAPDNPCGYGSPVPCDDVGHGTHTMGTMVGDDGKGNQIGMAPGAKWMACRSMAHGFGSLSWHLECLEFFLAPYAYGADPINDGDANRAPHVVNNSWGCDPLTECSDEIMGPALHALRRAGIAVVAAAGNGGPECSTVVDAPARFSSEVISVGAFDFIGDKLADFSSRGPSGLDGSVVPSIVAPGVGIRSSTVGGDYSPPTWQGTSMASPHVSGAIALLWSAHPGLVGRVEDTSSLMKRSAVPQVSAQTCGGISGNLVPNNTSGHGFLDIYKAAKDYSPVFLRSPSH